MAQNIIQTTDPCCPVKLEPVTVAGAEVPKLAVMVQDDKEQWRLSGMVSESYNLVPNEKVMQIADDIMTRSPYNWSPFGNEKRTLGRHWDGRKFIQTFWTDETAFKVKGKLTRTARIGLMIRNSYDGSSVFSMEFCLCFLECLNQFVHRNRFGSFVIRHSGSDFDVDDAILQVGEGGERLMAFAPHLEGLQEKPIGIPDVARFVKQDLIPKSKIDRLLDKIEDETEWGLMQAATDVVTHDCTGLRSFGHHQKIGEHFLKGAVVEEKPIPSTVEYDPTQEKKVRPAPKPSQKKKAKVN